MFIRSDVTDVSLTVAYSNLAGSQIVVSAGGNMKTNFMSVIGYSSIHIGSASTVKWGNTKLRVALVLDNTGSMSSSSKLTALKTATNNLLTQLKDAVVTDRDVYVSIIPFVKDLNVGSSSYDQLWIDWSDWDSNNGTCSKSGYSNQDSCTSHGTCSISYKTSQSSCTGAGGTWTAATWTSANHNTWNGCVTDRGNSGSPSSGNYDTNVETPKTGIIASGLDLQLDRHGAVQPSHLAVAAPERKATGPAARPGLLLPAMTDRFGGTMRPSGAPKTTSPGGGYLSRLFDN
jgi:hypothetical protein